MSDACGRCNRAFDPTDTAWDGRARYRDTQWCRSCIDRCHESTDFAHVCAICRPVGYMDRTPDWYYAEDGAIPD